MSTTTIESLQLEITSNAKGATSGLDALGKSLDKLGSVNKRVTVSFTDFSAKARSAVNTLKKFSSTIWSCIKESNDYVENLNLFTVSMGEYAAEAKEYAETVGEVMGIDPGEWMRNQGIFMTLATGFGVAGDRANVMSQQLTQLGYDLSSFFNMDVKDTMQKLQSGISGELEPLRRLGYDLSQAKLEATALSLGIDKSVSSMTQAEKAQLRYYAIMTQVTSAQGDMARTLEAPANQLRILKAQFTQAARAIGNIFIPILTKVLPYAIAVTKVVRILANEIANLFGYELPEVDYSGVKSTVGSVSEGLDDATESAKKLKSYMLGFDELNVIDPKSGNSGAEDLASQFDFELPTYDFIGEATESKVNQIVEDMKEWLGITDDINSWSDLLDTRLGHILETVGLIGAGILAWKVTKTFMDSIATLKALLASPSYAIAIGVTLTLTGFAFEFSGLKDAVTNGLSGFNFAEIVGGGLLGTGGATLLGSKLATWISTTFAGSKVAGALTAAASNLGLGTAGAAGAALGAGVAGIVAGIPAMIVGIYDACVNGIDWLSSLLIPAGATAAGAGIGVIIGACGGPIGAGIGALIGLIVGAVVDLVILIVQKWDVIVAWCKDACTAIGQFFVDVWNGIVGVWEVVSEWFNTYVVQPIAGFFRGMWEDISTAASESWQAIVDFFSPAFKWFSELFGSIFETISDIFYNIGVIASGCWEIIKAVWDIVSEWFDTNVIQPVAGFFSELWAGVKEKALSAWNGIKSVFSTIGNWIYNNLIAPVGKFFTELWDGFLKKAKSAWEGVQKVFSTVADFFHDTFEKAWKGIVKVFSVAGEIFVDIKDGIISVFKTVVNGLIKGINKVVAIPFNGINKALDMVRNIEILGLKPFDGLISINVPQIPLLADGGMVDNGQMFIAREAGPELVGSIGRRTAVANNDQIVDGIANGVAEANSEQTLLLREQNSLLRALLEKESGVYLDGRSLTNSVEKYQRERGRVLITGGVV